MLTPPEMILTALAVGQVQVQVQVEILVDIADVTQCRLTGVLQMARIASARHRGTRSPRRPGNATPYFQH